MQIRFDTAQGMGYRGPARGLLDADTNLKFAVAYLSNAYLVAGGNPDRALALYASGYFYEARRKGLLDRLRTAQGG
jgi:soluble lytic murein transglycosylase-like protein